MSTPGKGINDRIKSENGFEKEKTTGIPYDGTVDPTGENPRRTNWFGVSTSQAQRGVKINTLSLGGGSFGVNFDVSVPSASIYPYNNAFESLSGHSFEIDDTPGNERILIKHHSGAGIEIQPDGGIVIVSKGKSVFLSNGEYNMAVTGSGNISYDGDLNMNVNGNYNLKVNGTYNIEASNSMNVQVHDSLTTEVGDTHQTLVRGNKDVKVYGDTLDFHVGERKIVTKKDLRIIPKRDFIVNSKRHIRFTAEEFLTAATGKLLSLSSERMNVSGRKGKIGGDNFHFLGTLFTGPSGDKGDPRNDQGQKTVFHGNLIGRALESWTSKYSLNAREAHSAHISNFATIASHADTAGNASRASFAVQALQAAAVIPIPPLPIPVPEKYPDWIDGETWEGADGNIVGANKPDYKFKWGWNVKNNTAYEQPLNMIENYEWDGKGEKTGIEPIPIAPFYTTNEDWFEVWNKTSPFAVRKIYVDEDGGIENKLYKPNIYSHYFHHTPDTSEIRAKLRTMDLANDPKTCPEMQCDHDKAEAELVSEGRLSGKYLARQPPPPYKERRKGTEEPIARFGHTPLGNPKEKFSKTFTPKNKPAFRKLLIDPRYNPYRQETPITPETKLSKSTTMSTFLGAAGSKTSFDQIPIAEDRMDLARYWVCHSQIIDGVNSSSDFKNYRLAVTEGYYHPNSGIREHYKPGEGPEKRYWREPYRNEDGGIINRTISGHPVNQRKHEGMYVVTTLFNSRGKIDYAATFDCALYIRDTFYFRELHLDYDITGPDDIQSAQIGIYMPVIPDQKFEGEFLQKVATYYNRSVLKDGDLLEITDVE